MPKSRPPYDVEFCRRVVELVRSGKAIEALSREFGPTSTSIRNWVRQADLDEGVRKDGLTSDEKAELTTLRRENARLREERDILKNSRVRPGRPPVRRETPGVGRMASREEWPPAFWCSANP